VVRERREAWKALEPAGVVALAQALCDGGTHEGRQVGYLVLEVRQDTRPLLDRGTLETLGAGNDNWASVDTFATLVAGPAWRVGSVTGAAGESTARSFYGADDQGVHSPLDFQSTGAIKQFFDLSDDWSLLWGLSAANGPNASGKNTRSDVYGTDLYLKYRPITRASYTVVSLQAEWLYRRRQLPLDLVQDTGGYVELFWRFAKRWGTAARYEYGSPPLDLGGERTVDPLDPEQTDARHRGTLSNTFWPTEFSRLRLQGSADFPGWRPQPILAAFLALEVVVGAHGAHKF